MKLKTYHIVFFISILLIPATWSCGTRKVQKSHEEVNTTVHDTNVLNINAASETSRVTDRENNVEENVNWDETSATITPADPAKPMTITDNTGKKTVFENAAVQFGKKSGTSHTLSHDKVVVKEHTKDTTAINQTTGKQDVTISKKDSKGTERDGIASTITFWVFIAALICIWFLIFKHKKENT